MNVDMNIRVLTEGFVARLAKLNHVSRQLRRLGYRVTEESASAITVDLNQHHARPLLDLARGGWISRQTPDGHCLYATHIGGVCVTWQEPSQGRRNAFA